MASTTIAARMPKRTMTIRSTTRVNPPSPERFFSIALRNIEVSFPCSARHFGAAITASSVDHLLIFQVGLATEGPGRNRAPRPYVHVLVQVYGNVTVVPLQLPV